MGIDLALAASRSYFLYLKLLFVFSPTFVLWIFATWFMSLCQIKLRSVFKQKFGDFRKVEVFLCQGVFWSLTALILIFRLWCVLIILMHVYKKMRGPCIVDAFTFNSLFFFNDYSHCSKSEKCIKPKAGGKKTCVILPIIYMTLFPNMHGVKHIIDVQNIFVRWMTEPCIFSKSELCKDSSILFMKKIAFLPGLGVFLPERMLSASRNYNEHPNLQFSSSDENGNVKMFLFLFFLALIPSHRKPCSFWAVVHRCIYTQNGL